jgi:hypothetical protein
MVATQAMTGYGAQVVVIRGGVRTELAEVTKFTPPKLTSDEVDATHLKSPNRTKESIKGLRNPGSMPVDMNYIPGSPTDVYLLEWDATSDTGDVEITYPNGVKDTFGAFVLDYGGSDVVVDGKLQATVNLKVAGAITRS